MPTLYILSGPAYSGKTTLAQKLQEHGVKLISFDDHWVQLEQKGTTNFDLTYENLSNYLRQKIKQQLLKGISISYDSLNDTPDQRMLLKQIADETNSEYVILALNTSYDTIVSRYEEAKITKSRSVIPKANLDESFEKYVPPTEDENHLIVSAETKIEDIFQHFPIL